MGRREERKRSEGEKKWKLIAHLASTCTFIGSKAQCKCCCVVCPDSAKCLENEYRSCRILDMPASYMLCPHFLELVRELGWNWKKQ